MDADAVAQHEKPVWRERADFIIGAPLDEAGKWEQLWARQLAPNRFELCCIPFMTYGLALGDVVETETQNGHEQLVSRVVEPSGRFAMRVWFLETTVADEVAERLAAMGCLLEWRSHSSQLLAVDVSDEAATHAVAEMLRPYENEGLLNFETGWR
jgi:hypothetical protein